jgi:hypothetical protein
MYRGFNLKLDWYDEKYYQIGLASYKAEQKQVWDKLEDLVLPNGSLDGSKLQDDWFPEIEADIFLSHSHKNEKQAIALAGFLWKELQITTFIDSSVWAFADDLLLAIDKTYCFNENTQTYRYEDRNRSTSHVHLMLSAALSKMIDKTECLLFLNTPDSIQTDGIIDRTISPWIYAEIATSRLIRKKELREHRPLTKSFSDFGRRQRLDEQLSISHELQLGHLTKIDIATLRKWMQVASDEAFKLDVLYELCPPRKII